VQAQANRDHELVMAPLLLHAGINHSSTPGFIGPTSFSEASDFQGLLQMINPAPFYR